MAEVKIEGIIVPVADAIASNDTMLRDLLTTSYPDARTATFKRTTVGGTLTVEVNKQPGKKGSLIEALLTAPDSENPAVALSRKLAAMPKLTLAAVTAMQADIIVARDAGQIETKAVHHALRSLLDADAVAAVLPMGF